MFSPPYASAPIGATNSSAPSSALIANCLKKHHLRKCPCNTQSTYTGHPSCLNSTRLPIIHRKVDGWRAGRSRNTEAPYHVLSNEIFERQDIATITTRHHFGQLDINGYSDTDGHQRSRYNSREFLIANSEFFDEATTSDCTSLPFSATKITSPDSSANSFVKRHSGKSPQGNP